jgi:hypothetical protein
MRQATAGAGHPHETGQPHETDHRRGRSPPGQVTAGAGHRRDRSPPGQATRTHQATRKGWPYYIRGHSTSRANRSYIVGPPLAGGLRRIPGWKCALYFTSSIVGPPLAGGLRRIPGWKCALYFTSSRVGLPLAGGLRRPEVNASGAIPLPLAWGNPLAVDRPSVQARSCPSGRCEKTLL